MKRKNIYWISQVSGWLLYYLVNITAIFIFAEYTWQRAALLLYLVLSGFTLTHLYRNKVKKKDWISLPLKKIIPLILLACVVIGILMYVPYFLLNYFLQIYPIDESIPGTIFLGILNMTTIVFFWSLIYFSVHVFENYKRAEIESYVWEAAVKDFELKTLKSQLNPHFMFNAMNSIRALIEEDPSQAKVALTRLSNILRYSLRIERTETVPLEDEIQTVRDYLMLEKIRFEERLKYNLNVDPRSAKIEIPPMMIQTLVENGIKHGISKCTKGGEIIVDTSLSDSRLFIKIRNTGQVDPEAVKHAHGFGISNTKHRLSLLYGEKSSFKIYNEDPENVSSEIVIPTGGTK